MNELVLGLDRGGEASLVETDGDHVTLDASRAFPPGSTLEASSALGALRVKVRSCTQRGERYRVEGRFVNLPKQIRAALLGG